MKTETEEKDKVNSDKRHCSIFSICVFAKLIPCSTNPFIFSCVLIPVFVLCTTCLLCFILFQTNLFNSIVKVPLCFASQNKGGMWKELSKCLDDVLSKCLVER